MTIIKAYKIIVFGMLFIVGLLIYMNGVLMKRLNEMDPDGKTEEKRRMERIRRDMNFSHKLEMAEASGSVWENRYLYLAEQMARVQLYAHRGDLQGILKITKEANTYEHIDRRDDGLDRSPFCGAGHHVIHAAPGAQTQKNAAASVGTISSKDR